MCGQQCVAMIHLLIRVRWILSQKMDRTLAFVGIDGRPAAPSLSKPNPPGNRESVSSTVDPADVG